MRLWTVHPKYLDAVGLVALWRESLLAQKVLMGGTKGWRKHPQLDRFKGHPEPVSAIGFYCIMFMKKERGEVTTLKKKKLIENQQKSKKSRFLENGPYSNSNSSSRG